MTTFGQLVEAEIPRLRRYAIALLRNQDAANDLVQDTLLRALTKEALWQPGTDLRAWLFTLMHHEHVNRVRRAVREGVKIDPDSAVLQRPPSQHASLELRDLKRALDGLSEEFRAVLLLIGLEGLSYEQTASVLNIKVGTVRSRLSRAREALRARLVGEPPLAARPNTAQLAPLEARS